MVEFKLNPKPTFKADVSVPRPGDEDGVLTFTFKHKKRTQLELLEKSLRETLELQSETGIYSNEPMADFLMEICAGWALPEEFNRENMLVLLDNYPRAFDSIATLFTRETDGRTRKKLIALAKAFYTPEPAIEDLGAFGLSAADYDPEIVEAWPDIWPAFQVFQAMGTQWRVGMQGVSGLDYNCLPWLMTLYGVDDEASAFSDIRVMESAALRIIHSK